MILSDDDPKGVRTMIDSGVCGLGALKGVSTRGRIQVKQYSVYLKNMWE